MRMTRCVFLRVLYALLVVMLFTANADKVVAGGSADQLYLEASSLFSRIDRASTLPDGKERTTVMTRAIRERWDEQIVQNLEMSLRMAPHGRYAHDARILAARADTSRMLASIRSLRPVLQKVWSGNAYRALLQEARTLANALHPRSHTAEEVMANLQARVEVKKRAEEAFQAGRITQAQRDEIVKVVRTLPSTR